MTLTASHEHDGAVVRLRLDRAARGNSLDHELLEQLVTALESAAADASTRVLRLDMAGAHFCGGWDTRSFAGLASATTDEVAGDLRRSDVLLDRVRALPVPVVAAVRGSVIGFGVGLLDALHLPVVADDVAVTLPEARFGFAPAGVGHRVAQAVPRARALALLAGVDTADAHDLLAWGWAVAVHSSTDLDSAVDALVDRLVGVPADALRGVLAVVRSSLATGRPDDAFTISARTVVAALRPGGDA